MAEVYVRPLTLADMAAVPLPPSFVFVIDGKEYRCQVGLAITVSPVIRKQMADPNVKVKNRFAFTGMKDLRNEFGNFMKLISGGEIDINTNNAPFFYEIGRRLEIVSLCNHAHQMIARIQPEKYLETLKDLGDQGIDISGLIDYVANNWNKFCNHPKLLSLPLSCFELIFSHKNFEVTDTDTFFELLCKIVRARDLEFRKLFHFIDMTRLSQDQMERLLGIVCCDDIPQELFPAFESRLKCEVCFAEEEEGEEQSEPPQSSFVSPLWGPQIPDRPKSTGWSMGSRLQGRTASEGTALKPVAKDFYASSHEQRGGYLPPTRHYSEQKLPPRESSTPSSPAEEKEFKWVPSWDDEDEPIMSGVLANIIRERPRDWAEYIEVTGGGTKQKMLFNLFEYHQIFKFHWDSYDVNAGIRPENAWLQVHLTHHQLVLKHYTIATSVARVNSQPKSWRLEASSDGVSWMTISTVRGCQKTKSSKQTIITTAIQTRVPAYSYFKLVQTENWARANAPNAGELRVNAIELYGILVS